MPVGLVLGREAACRVAFHHGVVGLAFQGVRVCVWDVGSARKFMNRLKE